MSETIDLGEMIRIAQLPLSSSEQAKVAKMTLGRWMSVRSALKAAGIERHSVKDSVGNMNDYTSGVIRKMTGPTISLAAALRQAGISTDRVLVTATDGKLIIEAVDETDS